MILSLTLPVYIITYLIILQRCIEICIGELDVNILAVTTFRCNSIVLMHCVFQCVISKGSPDKIMKLIIRSDLWLPDKYHITSLYCHANKRVVTKEVQLKCS